MLADYLRCLSRRERGRRQSVSREHPPRSAAASADCGFSLSQQERAGVRENAAKVRRLRNACARMRADLGNTIQPGLSVFSAGSLAYSDTAILPGLTIWDLLI